MRTDTGTCATSDAVWELAARLEVPTQRSAAQRQHDVIDLRVERGLDREHLGHRDRSHRKAPLGADDPVEARPRRRERAGRRFGTEHLARKGGGLTRQLVGEARRTPRQRNDGAQRPQPERGGRRGALPFPCRRRTVGGSRVTLEVHDEPREVHPGDAIDERVVDLDDEGDAPVVEPVDPPRLPQRAAPVELPGDQHGHEIGDLAAGAGRRHLRAMEVRVEVEVRIVDQHGPVEAQGSPDQPGPQDGRAAQSARVAPPHRLEGEAGGIGRVEDQQRRDVHVPARGLAVEEPGAGTVNSSHDPPASSGDDPDFHEPARNCWSRA